MNALADHLRALADRLDEEKITAGVVAVCGDEAHVMGLRSPVGEDWSPRVVCRRLASALYHSAWRNAKTCNYVELSGAEHVK